MKLTNEIIEQAKKIAETAKRDGINGEYYEYFGLRIQGVPFELGQFDLVQFNLASHIRGNEYCWVNGHYTVEELGGVSTIDVDSLKANQFNAFFPIDYYGDYVAIIAGNSAEAGEHKRELVIHDPVVIASIRTVTAWYTLSSLSTTPVVIAVIR